MEIYTNNNTHFPETIKELLDDMQRYPNDYKHLQIILNRHDNSSFGLGQNYLVVTDNGFDVYKLVDVDYAMGVMQLALKCRSSSEVEHIVFRIANKRPGIVLISWNDIRMMVNAEHTNNYLNDILELEND